jgi:hypothetical protein
LRGFVVTRSLYYLLSQLGGVDTINPAAQLPPLETRSPRGIEAATVANQETMDDTIVSSNKIIFSYFISLQFPSLINNILILYIFVYVY